MQNECNCGNCYHWHDDNEYCGTWCQLTQSEMWCPKWRDENQANEYRPGNGPFHATASSGEWVIAGRGPLITRVREYEEAEKMVDVLNRNCREWTDQPTQPAWIDCRDRLPREGEKAVVLIDGGLSGMAFGTRISGGTWLVERFADYCRSDKAATAGVTHWLPLPRLCPLVEVKDKSC